MKSTLITLASCFFISIYSVSSFFFVWMDKKARMSRLAFAVLTGSSAVFVIYGLSTTTSSSLATQIIGGSLFSAALGLFWWTFLSNRHEKFDFVFSGRHPEKLVISGPYRWIRHPFYSSYLLAWTGSFVTIPSIVTGAILLLMLYLYLTAARQEEARFRATPLATQYAAYSKETGMFLPFL